jgi:hypothetical protein
MRSSPSATRSAPRERLRSSSERRRRCARRPARELDLASRSRRFWILGRPLLDRLPRRRARGAEVDVSPGDRLPLRRDDGRAGYRFTSEFRSELDGCSRLRRPSSSGLRSTTRPLRRPRSSSRPAPLGDGAACDDGNGCDTGDVCRGAVCVRHRSRALRPRSNPGSCEPATGRCNESPLPTAPLARRPTNVLSGPPQRGEVFPQLDSAAGTARPDFDGVCISDDDCPTANPGQRMPTAISPATPATRTTGSSSSSAEAGRTGRATRRPTAHPARRAPVAKRRSTQIRSRRRISVRIEDGASFAQSFTWAAGQCTGSGRPLHPRGTTTARDRLHPLAADGRRHRLHVQPSSTASTSRPRCRAPPAD